jgi:orotidine-5'-phosphate decarboxylase
MAKIIEIKKSIIPACDFGMQEFRSLLLQTIDIKKIGGYKIGFQLALEYGLPQVVEEAKRYTDKPLIYDHQKAATDIPYTGKRFAKVVKDSGIDAVILFPFSGPETQEAWIKSSQDEGLGVIVGGEMTHDKFKSSDGGYIDSSAIRRIYLQAAELGISDFVVPGNKLDSIRRIRKIVESKVEAPIFYSPGFIDQRGEISEGVRAAGPRFHAFVGRGIYQSKDPRKTTINLTKLLEYK